MRRNTNTNMCEIKPYCVSYTPEYCSSIVVLHKRLKTTTDTPSPRGRVVNDLNDGACETVSTVRPPPHPLAKGDWPSAIRFCENNLRGVRGQCSDAKAYTTHCSALPAPPPFLGWLFWHGAVFLCGAQRR